MAVVTAFETGTLEQKLRDIQRFLAEGCGDAEIHELAHGILRASGTYRVTGKDPWTKVEALFRWMRDHIRFERDPLTAEIVELGGVPIAGPVDLIQNAAATLERQAGDCVAQTVLMGSLACAIGLPVKIGLQDTQGRGVDHVLLLVGIPAEAPATWLPVDLTLDQPGQLRAGHGPVQVMPI